MKSHAKPVCCALLVWLIIMLPGTDGSEFASVRPGYKADQLFEQIRDLELMQRNIEACYQAENGAPMAERVSRLSRKNPEGLDGALVNRVFGYLAGTPEYERFVRKYRILVQRPDYQRLHAVDLFAEYMRFLESGRIRFLTRLQEWQASSAERCSAQVHEGLAQPVPLKTIAVGYPESAKRAGSSGSSVDCVFHPIPVLKGENRWELY